MLLDLLAQIGELNRRIVVHCRSWRFDGTGIGEWRQRAGEPRRWGAVPGVSWHPAMTHPILTDRRRLLLYLALWLPISALLGAGLTILAEMSWLRAGLLAVPLALILAFLCLAAWFPARAAPLATATLRWTITKHILAAMLSSAVWQFAGGMWATLAERLLSLEGLYDAFAGQIPILFVTGALLYLLAVAASYLSIASEASRRAETRALEAQQAQALAARELELTRALQRRLLPPPESTGAGYRLAARNRAAQVVAGDFYDYFTLADGSLIVAIADVAGKGMVASLITATVKAMLPLVAAGRSVTETLITLNDKLVQELGAREFVALALARFEPESGHLELANAGLPDAYILRSGGSVETLVAPQPRLPLGIFPQVDYQHVDTHLGPTDRCLLVTDGLPEAPKPNGEPLGYEALEALIGNVPPSEPAAWLDRLLSVVEANSSEIPEDDWTALLVERIQGPAH